MELRIVVAAVRRRLVLLLLLGLIGAVAASVGVGAMEQRYRASATLLLDPTAVLVPGQTIATGDPERYVDSQLRVLSSAALADRAAAGLDGPTGDDVRDSLTLTQVTGSDVVEVVAEASTPEEARELANAVADAYVAGRREESEAARQGQVDALDAQIAALQPGLLVAGTQGAESVGQQLLADQIAALQTQRNALGLPTATQDRTAVLDPATAPTASQAPPGLLVALGGGLLGLLVGTVVAVLREARRPHVMSGADAHTALGLVPVTQFVIGRHSRARRARTRAASGQVSAAADLVRPATTLAATVTGHPAAHTPRRLVVCGASDPAGSWDVASSLAVAMARQGSRVALIPLPDGSTDRSDLVVTGAHETAWTQEPAAESGVTLWRAGPASGPPTPQLVQVLLDALPPDCDVAVLHAPPVLRSPVAARLAVDADGLVLAVLAGDERADDLDLARRTLMATGVTVHPVMVRRRGSLSSARRA